MKSRTAGLAIGLLALIVHPTHADANTRFPSSRMLVAGPHQSDDVLALQTTFGVVVSTDHGAHWHLLCEAALGYSGSFDPAVALAANGQLAIALPDGITTTPSPYCTLTRPPTAPAASIADLTVDVLGSRLAAAFAPMNQPQGVYLSDDNGASWQRGWTLTNFYIATLDIAPGHPSRVYASGYVLGTSTVPTLFRSDDGGATFVRATTNFQNGFDAYIAWVDPANADTIYVRSNVDTGGTMLLRSDDGGGTFRELVRTHQRMLGAAFAPDGMRMWVGSPDPDEGVLRSTDGGAHWQRVACGFSVVCLRYAGNTLYACGDSQVDRFALARSTDDGEHFTPLLNFADLPGPTECPSGTTVADQCAMGWPALSATLATLNGDAGPRTMIEPCVMDAGSGDASMDASADADVVVMARDVVASDRGTEPGGGHTCGCRAVGRRASGGSASWAGWLAIAVGLAARRREARPSVASLNIL